jgi:energy-coupling factor transporter ATP-binding protein EcfA2
VIHTLAFGGYRSLRELCLSVGRLTVITGGNGAGKSNVYRALRLLVDAAHGELGRALAREGGMPSALWAGTSRNPAARLSVGFADDVYAYELRLGLLRSAPALWSSPATRGQEGHPHLASRGSVSSNAITSAMLRDNDGIHRSAPADLYESVLSQPPSPIAIRCSRP